MKKKLYLIDGTALIYRAYYAFIRNPLYTSTGINTSAMFGTFNMFLAFIKKFDPQYMMISFDQKEKTFRHELDVSYKMNRPPAPPEMIDQIQPVKDFFKLAGVKEISISGYEADDVLASAAVMFQEDFEIIIVTGDKDFAQIVSDQIKIYDPKKEIIIDKQKVKDKYDITPEMFIDYLAICGDSADNIPGVKGIGPKGAARLLNEFGDLDGIYNSLDKISSQNIQKKLIEHKDEALLSRQLATIITDLPLKLGLADLVFKNDDLINTIDLLQKFELNKLADQIKPPQQDLFDIFNEGSVTEKKSALEYELVNTAEQLTKLCTMLSTVQAVAIDTETTSTDPMLAQLVGISICIDDKKAYYLPIAHQMDNNLDPSLVQNQLESALKNKLLIAHNYKYDYLVLTNAGYNLSNQVFDSMIADYLLKPELRHSLENCADRYFSYDMMPISELIGTGKKQITFDLVSSSQAAFYAAEDAWITFRLYKIQKAELQVARLDKLFQEIEIPLIFTLAEMERKGVHIDLGTINALRKETETRIGSLTHEIYQLAGSQFNLNSTQQLAKVLFEDLKIPPVKKTKTGYSTNQAVLEKLAPSHKIASLILEYRTHNKLLSTYIKALPALINPLTGRIHSSFNQTVASTGRLSSSNPNLQNIPIRTRLGKEVRKAFCAPDQNTTIVAADYSQIELRVFAILTRDQILIDTFKDNKDIHRKTASLIYKIPEDEVSSDQRRYAKVINFGLLYGMGAYRISNELNISHKEAQQFIDDYFLNFPSVRSFIDQHLKTAAQKGYVQTIMGRKLELPDLNSSYKMQREAARRLAVNMPVQGSAADIIKIAMNKLHNRIADNPRIKMLIQVHDELVFEVKDNYLEEAKALIRDIMENALPDEFGNIVPLVVDIGTGKNWFEAH